MRTRDELLTQLERHSQIHKAEYFLNQDGLARVEITWANGSRKTFDILQAVAWLESHPPRCWAWLFSPARNTERDYCTLTLDHDGPHKGDRDEW
jgi:hypothetical protein